MNLDVIFVAHQSVRRAFGYSLIGLSLFVTWVIWFSTLTNYNFISHDPFLFLSKLFVLAGTVAMCWTFMLATRAPLLECVFVGLDNVYHTHKNIGKLSFACICLHPLFQVMRFVPQWDKVIALFVPGINAVAFGLYAFIAFIILIACTIWIQIPYHIWKRTHEFFIVVLLFTFLHVYSIDKHVNASQALSIWMYGFMALAAISYFYIRFLYRFLGPRYEYTIVSIEKTRQTWNIYLAPIDKKFSYLPGQFIYVSFDNPVLGKEVHPFSVSSCPSRDYLRISVKNLGDYTEKMDALQSGDHATIWGPYGRFYEKYIYEDKDAVFIAGGIGVTPFLSMLACEMNNPTKRKSYIFYCIKDPSRADFNQELLHFSKHNPSIMYIPYCADEKGFLNVDKMKEHIGEFDMKNFFLCGPRPMMDSFVKQLKKAGVKNSSIILEDFNFV